MGAAASEERLGGHDWGNWEVRQRNKVPEPGTGTGGGGVRLTRRWAAVGGCDG